MQVTLIVGWHPPHGPQLPLRPKSVIHLPFFVFPLHASYDFEIHESYDTQADNTPPHASYDTKPPPQVNNTRTMILSSNDTKPPPRVNNTRAMMRASYDTKPCSKEAISK